MIKFVIVWLLATAVLFTLLDILPGDAASNQVGKSGAEAVRLLRHEMGLDLPLHLRYFHWLSGLFRGQLGLTYVTRKPVWEVIQVPLLSSLTVAGIVFAALVCFTLPLAVLCGYYNNVWTRIINKISVFLASIPEFILTVLLLLLLAIQWRVLPVLSNPGPGETVWSRPLSLLMPSLCLYLICSVSLFRHLRVMIENYAQNAYIREARMSGLSGTCVLFIHLLPSALGGMAQLLASTIPYLLGGAMIVERISSFPGMGYTLVSAIQSRESPVVMALGSLLIFLSLIFYRLADGLGRMGAGQGVKND